MARRLSLAAANLAMLGALFGPSLAQAQASGAQQSWALFDACMACHARDKALVGPSFAAIRERYEQQADAANVLAERIAQGSSGRWGAVPMPANSQLTPDQALAAARWILGSKPASASSQTPPPASPPVSQPTAH
ncbi:c-type cytochrome [Paucibacter sp. KCTC 42545]|uniref:c-type cytochrome n=1 Tax=Paucibacter sp. KCTC 42545 TaxID=1768242 RepID=UPI0012E37968|nr:c-type cytochrome [Paucibacter sp. KCTC 42545]